MFLNFLAAKRQAEGSPHVQRLESRSSKTHALKISGEIICARLQLAIVFSIAVPDVSRAGYLRGAPLAHKWHDECNKRHGE
jgi:hypothetical protein